MELSLDEARQQLVHAVNRIADAHHQRRELQADGLFTRLESFQKERLHRSFADVAAMPRFAKATAFFTDELYAPDDLPQRDSDIRRMVPIMVRLLPAEILITVAKALELQGLSQELDAAIAKHLLEHELDVTPESYAQAYRNSDQSGEREKQLGLLDAVGKELDAVVHKRWLYRTLKLARTPAAIAGLSTLQGFLERGFKAFRTMDSAQPFLEVVESRESQVMQWLRDGTKDDSWWELSRAENLATQYPIPKSD